MEYEFLAYTTEKKIVHGTIEAISVASATEEIRRMGYSRILQLKYRPTSRLIGLLKNFRTAFYSVKNSDVLDFSRELGYLLKTGFPIIAALQLIERQTPKEAFRNILTGIIDSLRGGNTFAEALTKYPKAFSELYCNVIKTSEKSGSLDVGLTHLAGYLESQEERRRRIKSALTYPILVTVLAIGVGMLLTVYVLPSLLSIYGAVTTDLPIFTRIVAGTGNFLVNYKFHLFFGVLCIAITTFAYARLASGKRNLHILLTRLPVLGKIIVQTNLLHFCYSASMLLRAGLPINQVLRISSDVISNIKIRRAFKQVEKMVNEGQRVSAALKSIHLFPPTSVEMLAIGEGSGDLEEAFNSIAMYLDRNVNRRMDRLIGMIQPAATLVVGAIAGLIALSVISPIYSLLGSIE